MYVKIHTYVEFFFKKKIKYKRPFDYSISAVDLVGQAAAKQYFQEASKMPTLSVGTGEASTSPKWLKRPGSDVSAGPHLGRLNRSEPPDVFGFLNEPSEKPRPRHRSTHNRYSRGWRWESPTRFSQLPVNFYRPSETGITLRIGQQFSSYNYDRFTSHKICIILCFGIESSKSFVRLKFKLVQIS